MHGLTNFKLKKYFKHGNVSLSVTINPRNVHT
jgi:hypothetical protein